MARKEPAVVAELGRPETPDETAQRKAEASARRRAHQTVFNLVLATAASLLVVLFLIFVVVRPAPPPPEPVDYVTIAAQTGAEVIAPSLPDGWRANTARLVTDGGVRTWSVGFLTPADRFIALKQGLDANPTWLAQAVEGAQPTGTERIGGLSWTSYDRRDAASPGNFAFALSAELNDSVVVLHGTADDAEFAVLAAAVAAEADAR